MGRLQWLNIKSKQKERNARGCHDLIEIQNFVNVV